MVLMVAMMITTMDTVIVAMEVVATEHMAVEVAVAWVAVGEGWAMVECLVVVVAAAEVAAGVGVV